MIFVTGAIYGWGRNNFGQLGVDDTEPKYYPNLLKTLRNQKVKYVACGEEFSVFLTQVSKLLIKMFKYHTFISFKYLVLFFLGWRSFFLRCWNVRSTGPWWQQQRNSTPPNNGIDGKRCNSSA